VECDIFITPGGSRCPLLLRCPRRTCDNIHMPHYGYSATFDKRIVARPSPRYALPKRLDARRQTYAGPSDRVGTECCLPTPNEACATCAPSASGEAGPLAPGTPDGAPGDAMPPWPARTTPCGRIQRAEGNTPVDAHGACSALHYVRTSVVSPHRTKRAQRVHLPLAVTLAHWLTIPMVVPLEPQNPPQVHHRVSEHRGTYPC